MITGIEAWQGFTYLAAMIVCYCKRVIGWSIADHLRTELVADAPSNAAATGVIGVCGDNAMAESFFSALKNGRVCRTVCGTKKQTRRDVISFIEGFYNSRRRHSALGYQRLNEIHNSYQ